MLFQFCFGVVCILQKVTGPRVRQVNIILKDMSMAEESDGRFYDCLIARVRNLLAKL